MDSNTLNLLLGAGISLVSVITTALINYGLQGKREKTRQRRQILLDRINKIEKGAASIVYAIDKFLFSPIVIDKQSIKEITEQFDSVMAEGELSLIENKILENEIITKCVKDLTDYCVDATGLFTLKFSKYSDEYMTVSSEHARALLIAKDEFQVEIANEEGKRRKDEARNQIDLESIEKCKEISTAVHDIYVTLLKELDKMRSNI